FRRSSRSSLTPVQERLTQRTQGNMRCYLFVLLLIALAGCSKIPHRPLEWAEHEVGVQTWMEARPNPRIMEYINAFAISAATPPEEIAHEDWCGFFAAW